MSGQGPSSIMGLTELHSYECSSFSDDVASLGGGLPGELGWGGNPVWNQRPCVPDQVESSSWRILAVIWPGVR